MGKSIFQVVADWIEQPEPVWLKNAMLDLQNAMVYVAEQAGKAYLQMLASKIIAVSSDTSLTGAQKFQSVFTTATDPANTVKPAQALGNDELNLLIQGIVSMFKMSGTIA